MSKFSLNHQRQFVKIAVIIILLSYIAVKADARTGGDAVYRVGGWLNNLDHAGVYDTNGFVYEIRGPFTQIQRSSWSIFLDDKSYIGEFTNPTITHNDRNDILGTCAQMDAETDITYTVSSALYYESNSGVDISVDEITDIRCDGVVEYAYERNEVWIWGKADPPISSGTPTHFDISNTAYCDEHANLGGDDPWFELSPKVQRGGSGEQWTKLRPSIAPIVTSVNSGNPVVGSSNRQWIPIGGSNFKSGFSATFRDVSNNVTYPTITDQASILTN